MDFHNQEKPKENIINKNQKISFKYIQHIQQQLMVDHCLINDI